MPLLQYRIVDVFTTEALEGNPLAVFTDASQIDEAIMQKIAREMNLAETTFVLPPESPDCAARVRIFTPKKEMRFAGHPTIGTSFRFAGRGTINNHDSFCLEEKIGPVQLVCIQQRDRSSLKLNFSNDFLENYSAQTSSSSS